MLFRRVDILTGKIPGSRFLPAAARGPKSARCGRIRPAAVSLVRPSDTPGPASDSAWRSARPHRHTRLFCSATPSVSVGASSLASSNAAGSGKDVWRPFTSGLVAGTRSAVLVGPRREWFWSNSERPVRAEVTGHSSPAEFQRRVQLSQFERLLFAPASGSDFGDGSSPCSTVFWKMGGDAQRAHQVTKSRLCPEDAVGEFGRPQGRTGPSRDLPGSTTALPEPVSWRHRS